MEDFYETHIGWIELFEEWIAYLNNLTLECALPMRNIWMKQMSHKRTIDEKKKNIHEHEEDFLAHLATLPFCLTIMLYLKLFDESFLFLLSFLSKANN